MSGFGKKYSNGLSWSLGKAHDFDLEFDDVFVVEETQEELWNRIRLTSPNNRFNVKPPFFSGDSFWYDDRIERKEIGITWGRSGGTLDTSIDGGYLYRDSLSQVWRKDIPLGSIGPSTTALGLTTAYEYILCACIRNRKTMALLSSGRLILSLSDFLSGDEELYNSSYIDITLPISISHYKTPTKNKLNDLGLSWTELAYFAFSQDGNKILAYKIDHYYNESITNGNDPRYLYDASIEFQKEDWQTSETYQRPTIFEWTLADGWLNYWSSTITNSRTENIVSLDQVQENPYPLMDEVSSPLLGTNFPLGFNTIGQVYTHEGYEANRSYVYNEDILVSADYINNNIRALIVNIAAAGTHYRKQLTERHDITWALSYNTTNESAWYDSFSYYRDDWDSGEPHTLSTTRFRSVFPFVGRQGVTANDTSSSETIDVTFRFLGEDPFLSERIVDVQDSVESTLNGWQTTNYEFVDFSYPDGEPEESYNYAMSDPFYGCPWNWYIKTDRIHPVYINPIYYGTLKTVSNAAVTTIPQEISVVQDRIGTFNDYRVVPFLYYPTYIYVGQTTMRKWNFMFYDEPGFYYLGRPNTSIQQVVFNGSELFSRSHEFEISPMWLDFGNFDRGYIFYNDDGEPVDFNEIPIPNTFNGLEGETMDNWPSSAWMGTPYLVNTYTDVPASTPNSGGGAFGAFLGPILRSFYLTKFKIKQSKYHSILATILRSDSIYYDKGDLIALLDDYLVQNGLTQSTKNLTNIRTV